MDMGASPIKETLNPIVSTSEPAVVIKIVCSSQRLPGNIKPLLGKEEIDCGWVVNYQATEQDNFFDDVSLVVVYPGKIRNVEDRRRVGKLLQSAHRKKIPLLVLSSDKALPNFVHSETEQDIPHIQFSSPEISADEVWGRICAMLEYSPVFNRMGQYLHGLEQWAFALNNRFEELHQELRLAWRVQQDFLPKRLPATDNIHFATLYRPASWVSGDIYDIFTLDEDHVGFYIADVVGHGVAAGLMTLFVKRALITKEITSSSYRLLSTNEALVHLNNDLHSVELPEHQFITACYGIINRHTMELTFSRGGHPYPILIKPDGELQLLISEGSLLGIFEDAEFPAHKIIFEKGSKLILVTDGLELAFGEQTGESQMRHELSQLAHLPAKEMAEALTGILDCQESSLHPADDISAIIIESC